MNVASPISLEDDPRARWIDPVQAFLLFPLGYRTERVADAVLLRATTSYTDVARLRVARYTRVYVVQGWKFSGTPRNRVDQVQRWRL